MSNLTEEFLKWLPKHQVLLLQHNPHLVDYTNASEFIMDEGERFLWPDVNAENESIVSNELWVLVWYSDEENLEQIIAAPTLEKLLLFAHDAQFRSDSNE